MIKFDLYVIADGVNSVKTCAQALRYPAGGQAGSKVAPSDWSTRELYKSSFLTKIKIFSLRINRRDNQMCRNVLYALLTSIFSLLVRRIGRFERLQWRSAKNIVFVRRRFRPTIRYYIIQRRLVRHWLRKNSLFPTKKRIATSNKITTSLTL